MGDEGVVLSRETWGALQCALHSLQVDGGLHHNTHSALLKARGLMQEDLARAEQPAPRRGYHDVGHLYREDSEQPAPAESAGEAKAALVGKPCETCCYHVSRGHSCDGSQRRVDGSCWLPGYLPGNEPPPLSSEASVPEPPFDPSKASRVLGPRRRWRGRPNYIKPNPEGGDPNEERRDDTSQRLNATSGAGSATPVPEKSCETCVNDAHIRWLSSCVSCKWNRIPSNTPKDTDHWCPNPAPPPAVPELPEKPCGTCAYKACQWFEVPCKNCGHSGKSYDHWEPVPAPRPVASEEPCETCYFEEDCNRQGALCSDDKCLRWRPRPAPLPAAPEGECPHWTGPGHVDHWNCSCLEGSGCPLAACPFAEEGRPYCRLRALAADRDALREQSVKDRMAERAWYTQCLQRNEENATLRKRVRELTEQVDFCSSDETDRERNRAEAAEADLEVAIGERERLRRPAEEARKMCALFDLGYMDAKHLEPYVRKLQEAVRERDALRKRAEQAEADLTDCLEQRQGCDEVCKRLDRTEAALAACRLKSSRRKRALRDLQQNAMYWRGEYDGLRAFVNEGLDRGQVLSRGEDHFWTWLTPDATPYREALAPAEARERTEA